MFCTVAKNSRDASDFGSGGSFPKIDAGGEINQNPARYQITAGDTMKNLNVTAYGTFQVDQLPPDQWMTITGPIDNNAGTFHILCPAGHAVDATCPSPGTGAFTDFTRGGKTIAGETGENFIFRLSYNPSTSYADPTYIPYGGEIMSGLKVLGYDVSSALAIFNARGGPSWYNSGTEPSQLWDTTVVVP